ncbi:acyltransferase [Sphingomonas sp. CBMAI 2297]|uniref:acyltransferase family protein n=1 Tax=Sphingomonas sp. CBMAI 2297 TaxID=2991720 RepID=UPI0024580EC4|nr:acyltransferase family protein [Sphingomonas sp. CBMAI 2297]MDH4742981.1 acyltransferase [Sphingomonas sp. CBMAI 2297]
MSAEGRTVARSGEPAAVLPYRAEVDGLRAVALLSVMAFHAGVPGFSGGFTGVDIFFVISGYLIGSIIWRETALGTFRLSQFYARRILRIFPALLVVLTCCSLLAMLVVDLDVVASFGAQMLASLCFAANIYLWRQPQGYFAAPEGPNPLVHLWSLGVEEQFYILFPLALLLLRRMGDRVAVASMALVAIASFALSTHLSGTHPGANFYLLPSRSWELLVGGLLAIGEPALRDRMRARRALAEAAGLLGVVLLVLPVFLYDATTPFPGWAALPTIAGTALIIGCSVPGTIVGGMLATRPLVAIGLISYSVYLWHQPLLAFARLLSIDHVGLSPSLGLLGVSFLLGAMSWRWIERPFRRGRVSAAGFVGLAAYALVLAAGAAALWFSGGLPQRFSAEQRALAGGLARANIARQVECSLAPGAARRLDTACTIGDPAGPAAMAILGDSHAIALAPAFSEGLWARHERAVLFTRAGCAPILPVAGLDALHRQCAAFHAGAIERVLQDASIQTVVLAARWAYDLERTGFDNGEGGVEASWEVATLPAARSHILEGYSVAVRRLLKGGKRVILIYPVPEAGWNVPITLARMRMLGVKRADGLTTSRAGFLRRQAPIFEAFDALGDVPGLIRVRPDRALCGVDRCTLTRAGAPLYFDDDHLTPEGASMLWIAASLAAPDTRR